MFNETYQFNITTIKPFEVLDYNCMNWTSCVERCNAGVSYALGNQAHLGLVIIMFCALGLAVFIHFRKNYPISFYDQIDFFAGINLAVVIMIFVYLAFLI